MLLHGRAVVSTCPALVLQTLRRTVDTEAVVRLGVWSAKTGARRSDKAAGSESAWRAIGGGGVSRINEVLSSFSEAAAPVADKHLGQLL